MIKFIKVLHLFFVMIWIGTLMVLAYLAGKKESDEKYNELQRKLYTLLDFPSMIFSLGLGLSLVFLTPISLKAGWFHAKMMGTFGLIVCDFWIAKGLFLNRKTKESRSVAFVLPIFLLLTLGSIFVLRDKQKEWQSAYEKERLAMECTNNKHENAS